MKNYAKLTHLELRPVIYRCIVCAYCHICMYSRGVVLKYKWLTPERSGEPKYVKKDMPSPPVSAHPRRTAWFDCFYKCRTTNVNNVIHWLYNYIRSK